MTSSKKNQNKYGKYEALMKRIMRAKLDHRVKLANLPFPEKVKIIRKLQDIDNSLAKAAGRKTKRVWEI